jgi:predicted anti-sigma-YlaC factor YlaD
VAVVVEEHLQESSAVQVVVEQVATDYLLFQLLLLLTTQLQLVQAEQEAFLMVTA